MPVQNAEYGRNYKISMLVLLGIWAIFAIMEHSGMIGEDILNTKHVVTIAALMGIVSHITATSMGSLNCKNDIIDLTLPVNTIERFTFIMLNSIALGVVVPTLVLDIPAQQFVPTLCTMALIHAALMVVACWGAKRGYSYAVLIFFAAPIGIGCVVPAVPAFRVSAFTAVIIMIAAGSLPHQSLYGSRHSIGKAHPDPPVPSGGTVFSLLFM